MLFLTPYEHNLEPMVLYITVNEVSVETTGKYAHRNNFRIMQRMSKITHITLPSGLDIFITLCLNLTLAYAKHLLSVNKKLTIHMVITVHQVTV